MTSTTRKTASAGLIIAVLALLSIFPPLATDMYLSGMDQIADALGASSAAVELSLSLFFLGLCVGQLFMGPIIDGYGRKVPLLIGVGVFTLTAIGLLLVSNVIAFNGLRVIQAMGACAGMVVGRAMVSDLYEGRQAAKTMSVLVMLMTIGPIISPFLGSLLVSWSGWRAVFYTMVVVGVVAAALAQIVLPESLPKEQRGEKAVRNAFSGYGRLLRSAQFCVPTIVTSLVQAAMFAFITASAGVFKGFYGLDNITYGIMFGVVALALVVFSHANTWFLNWFAPEKLINVGLPVFVVMAALLFVIRGVDNMWVFIVPLWVAIGFVGLLSANLMSVSMEAARGSAGVGSALIGACQFGVAFLCSSGVALIDADDATPMAFGILVPAVLALLIWFGGMILGISGRATTKNEQA